MNAPICHFAWDVPVRANFLGNRHGHPYVEVVYVDRSRGRLFQDGRVYPYADQSVFVYQPGGKHWVENETPGQHICVLFESALSPQLTPGVYAASAALRRHFLEVRDCHARTEPWQRQRLDLLAGIIGRDLLELGHGASRPEPPSRPEQIRRYIDDNLAAPLPLDELAAIACVNKDYLRQLFREAFGESIGQYINRRRMERAAELLRATDDKVRAIGAAVGIDNEFYFSRLFKKIHGYPPSAYRRR